MDVRRIRLLRSAATHYGIALVFSFFSSLFYARFAAVNPLLMGLFFALLFGTIFLLLDVSGIGSWKHRSFLVTSFARTAAYGFAICLGFAIGIGFIIYSQAKVPLGDPRLWRTIGRALLSTGVLTSAATTIFLAFCVSCFIAISRKLGPGVLLRWATGRYHSPRPEERVFMFLDIRDSTTLAERLGDLKFSALVRDFMADLSEPVIATRAEVSHYIGDEAVLVWKPENAFREDACIRLFHLMRERLAKRSSHYLREYGLVPGFKAGVHVGTSIVTEVGEIKSEIVYHGDTLNTTARIQGLCDVLGFELLVSSAAGARLKERGVPLGAHLLKGKAEPVEVCGYHPISLPADQRAGKKIGDSSAEPVKA